MKRLLSIALIFWCTSVFSSPDESDVIKQLSLAQKLHNQAKAENHSWVSTRRLIIKAKQALAEGSTDEAGELSALALQTATASVKQMERERSDWIKRVPGS